jgi:hypothetical protein
MRFDFMRFDFAPNLRVKEQLVTAIVIEQNVSYAFWACITTALKSV